MIEQYCITRDRVYGLNYNTHCSSLHPCPPPGSGPAVCCIFSALINWFSFSVLYYVAAQYQGTEKLKSLNFVPVNGYHIPDYS